jgi:AcrR family transcriptional regulator
MTTGPGGARPVAPGKPHDRILAVAIRLFLEEGIQAVGVRRIVEAAEVALMTVYRQFGGKDGVVAAALEQWSARWFGWLTDRLDSCGDDPEARFAGLWDALEERFASEELHDSLVAIAAIELRRTPGHPAWKVIAEHRRAMRQLLDDLVKPLDVDDPAALATRLHLLVESAAATTLAWGPDDLDLRELADAIRYSR